MPVKEDNEVYQESDYNPAEQLRKEEEAALLNTEQQLNDDKSPEGMALKEAADNHAASANKKVVHRTSRKEQGGQWQKKSDASDVNYTPKQLAGKLTSSLRKRWGILGLIGTFGLGGGLLVAFFGPASMLINLSQNLGIQNDRSSTVLERRVMKMMNRAFNADTAELCRADKVKCRGVRLSNGIYRKFNKNGMVPGVMRDGRFVPVELGVTGRPSETPTHFETEDGGKKTVTGMRDVPAFARQPGNEKYARLLYGTGVGSVINMKVHAWYGKHIKTRFFNKFNILRNGGIVSKAMKNLEKNERVQRASQRFAENRDRMNSVGDTVRSRVNSKIGGGVRKGGTTYATMLASCAAIKAQSWIAAAMAAIQIVELVNMFSDRIQGPGSAMAMNSLDNRIDLTPEDADVAGTLLTEQVARESDGRATTALDSQYLLLAAGVISTKLPMSQFAPGHAALTHPGLSVVGAADKALEPLCSKVFAPGTAQAMMAADMASTLLLSATILGGIAKIALGWAISAIAAAAAGMVVEKLADWLIGYIADADIISEQTGEALGDVIGIGATAFFAAGGMSRFIPSMNMSGVRAFNEMQQEQLEYQKQLDIAALSPFDTSSRYTFLGSIVNNMSTAMMQGGYHNNSIFSVAANIARLPAMALSFPQIAKADTAVHTSLCGYAEDFKQNTDNPEDDPGITISGLPCVGITPEMDAMSYDEAIDILRERGWISDDDSIIDDDDGITELLEKEYIKKETPMTDYIEDCGDASTGEYLLNAAGCVISNEEMTNSNDKLDSQLKSLCTEDDNGEPICFSETDFEGATGDTPDFRSMTAVVIFLLDYQAGAMLDGADDEVPGENNPPVAGGGSGDESGGEMSDDPVAKEGWVWPIKAVDQPRPGPCWGRNVGSMGRHAGMDINAGRANAQVYAMHDGDVIKITNDTYAGRNITVKTTTGMYYNYQHLSSISVSVGQKVKANQPIAKGGKTGRVYASSPVHLHVVVAREDITKPGKFPSYGNLRSSIDPMSVLPSPAPGGYKCT